MTTQDSQSELDKLVEELELLAGAHFYDYETAQEAQKIIEAYVTTRVKEALEAIPIRQEEDEWDAVDIVDAVQQHIFTQLEAITTTTNGKGE